MRVEPHSPVESSEPPLAPQEELRAGNLPPRPLEQLLIEPLPLDLRLDTTLPYRTGHRAGACRLRIFVPATTPVGAATPAVALVTEQPERQGLSVTNGIEVIAGAICHGYGLNPRHVVLIEHYDDRERGCAARLPGRVKGEKFSCVTFQTMQAIEGEAEVFHLRRPQWHTLGKAEVEALIGNPLP